MKKLVSTLGLLFMIYIAYPQNLVLNPGFEQYVQCPEKEGDFVGYVTHWTTYYPSPDYHHNFCPYYPEWVPSPYEGNGLAGLYTYALHTASGTARSEYIHGRLSSPLQSGSDYYVEYFMYQDTFSVAIDQHSIYFSSSPLDTIVPEYLSRSPSDTYHIPVDAQFNWGQIVSEFMTWVPIYGCFQVDGGEQLFTMGSFKGREETDTINPYNSRRHTQSIDYVRIYEVQTMVPPDASLCDGEILDLDPENLHGLQAFIKGEGIDSLSISQDSIYTIDYELLDCGYIGSRTITGKNCIVCPEYDPRSRSLCIGDTYLIPDDLPPELTLRDSDYNPINSFIADEVGLYSLIVSSPECDSISNISITVNECPEPELCIPYIPNVFSPNDDGLNDLFSASFRCPIQEDDFKLTIYDRWGNLIFNTTSPALAWDGRLRGLQVDTGVYLYVMDYKLPNEDQPRRLTGDVLALR